MDRFTIVPKPVHSRRTGALVATNFYVKDNAANEGRGKILTNWAFGTVDAALAHIDHLEKFPA